VAKAQLATEDMGKKRQCPSCTGRFYDLGKSPAECPYCETVFNPDEMVKGRRKPAAVAEAPKPKPEKKAAEPEEEVAEAADIEDADDDDDDDQVLEDASDLGEDEDDVADVIENADRKETE
jgi:uncharacterized protein (TIGR02300 family)